MPMEILVLPWISGVTLAMFLFAHLFRFLNEKRARRISQSPEIWEVHTLMRIQYQCVRMDDESLVQDDGLLVCRADERLINEQGSDTSIQRLQAQKVKAIIVASQARGGRVSLSGEDMKGRLALAKDDWDGGG